MKTLQEKVMARGWVLLIPPLTIALVALVALGGAARGADEGDPVYAAGACDDVPSGPSIEFSPQVATDGQAVYLDENLAVEDGDIVRLIGYRYNNFPPEDGYPEGSGREQIFEDCDTVKLVETVDGTFRLYFLVPMNAPMGHYSVEILPHGDTQCTTTPTCPEPNLLVTPSYIISTMESLDVHLNSEDDVSNPAEIQLMFTGGSGYPYQGSARVELPVEWKGTFPSHTPEHHLTSADHSTIEAQVPLFVGLEGDMDLLECREECLGAVSTGVDGCLDQCEIHADLYNNELSFGLGGLEKDDGPNATAWSTLASILVDSMGASSKVSNAVKDGVAHVLKNDDDDLGSAEVSVVDQGTSSPPQWGVGNVRRTVPFNGNKGSLDLTYLSHRVAAPKIIAASVELLSMKVTEDYEAENCPAPNEVYINARGMLLNNNTSLSDGGGEERIPEQGTYSLNKGDEFVFTDPERFFFEQEYQEEKFEQAPRSPFLYIEISVWEEDSEPDSFGIMADTLFIEEAIAKGNAQQPDPDPAQATRLGLIDEYTDSGIPTQRATFVERRTLRGYAGSDEHCYPWELGKPRIAGVDWDPQARQGEVEITYEVSLTWLMVPVEE